MILKGIGILAGTAALVIVTVMGLARLTAAEEPTFSTRVTSAQTARRARNVTSQGMRGRRGAISTRLTRSLIRSR